MDRLCELYIGGRCDQGAVDNAGAESPDDTTNTQERCHVESEAEFRESSTQQSTLGTTGTHSHTSSPVMAQSHTTASSSTQRADICEIRSSLLEHSRRPNLNRESHRDKLGDEIHEIDSALKALNCDIASNTVSQMTHPNREPPSVEAATTAAVHSTGLHLIGQLESGNSGSSSESEDSTSDSSESSIGIARDICQDDHVSDGESTLVRRAGQTNVPMIKGEIDYRTLLPEQCDIPFPEGGTVMPIGKVSHIAEKLVIIQALPGTPPFDEGTIIWNKEKKSIAKIFETFGPVKFPCYSVLVESINHATSLGLSPGQLVYVVPSNMELTKYIFTKQLMKQKGSDASWKDDSEVPPQFQDYSDDESEQAANSSRKQGGKRSRQQRTGSLAPPHSAPVIPKDISPQTHFCASPHPQHGAYPANIPTSMYGAQVDSSYHGYGYYGCQSGQYSFPSYSSSGYQAGHRTNHTGEYTNN